MILIAVILLVFLFDFTKLRSQNKRMIKQNDRIIELLERQTNERRE